MKTSRAQANCKQKEIGKLNKQQQGAIKTNQGNTEIDLLIVPHLSQRGRCQKCEACRQLI